MMGHYKLDLCAVGLSLDRLREIFTLSMGFHVDPDLMDIFAKDSESRATLIGNISDARWVFIDEYFILKFLANFTRTELGKIIHFLKFVDGSEGSEGSAR